MVKIPARSGSKKSVAGSTNRFANLLCVDFNSGPRPAFQSRRNESKQKIDHHRELIAKQEAALQATRRLRQADKLATVSPKL